MTLYLDLDGVLADFDRGVQAVTGQRPEALPLKTMWTALAGAPRFFETLEMMEDARHLWEFCAPLRPTILTGLPRGAWAPEQKRRWVARVLGAHVPVITCMSHEKPRWSGPGHVLVDDRASAREGWERKGGQFVHHVSAERSIAALRALGFGGHPGAARTLDPEDSGGRDMTSGKDEDQAKPGPPMEPQPQQPSGTGGGAKGGPASGPVPGPVRPGG